MTALRVAVVGSGPAGLYAIEHLLAQHHVAVEVDLYERLPTPWGLVRSGVAPDHPDKKRVIDRQFDFQLKDARVRFIGNVEIGRDIQHAELAQWYDGVIYAVGAASDTRMDLPGDRLPGCWAARQFVAYYNGHPDFSHLPFDLSCERAVIVGNGNVALDVARILTMPVADLERTDIADHALRALRRSRIREVVILGRRGLLQSAFHNPELEELGHLDGVDVVIEGDALPSDATLAQEDWDTRRKVVTLRRLAARPLASGHKRIVFRFLGSPVEVTGAGKVERLRFSVNRLERDGQGQWRAQATQNESLLETGLILRAVGYRGTPLPGLPFDERRGVIRNREGRVVDNDQMVPGVYVTGWIKRGCQGIIGSNRKCAHETVSALLEDFNVGRLPKSALATAEVSALIDARQPAQVPLGGWLAIDRYERDAGRAQDRPRVKITNLPALMLMGKGAPSAAASTPPGVNG